LAARRLGLREVPVIELSGLNEVQCRVLAIADNQLALNAGGDEDLLRVELGRLKPGRVKPLILSTSAGSEGCSNHKHSSTYLDSADLSGPDAVGGVYGPVHAGILGGT
jgi:hypothetical protein